MKNRTEVACVLAITLTSLVLNWFAAARLSPTIDEFAHLASGLELIQRRATDSYFVNPPLAKVVATIPQFVDGSRAPYSNSRNHAKRSEFKIGALFVESSPEQAWHDLIIARRILSVFYLLGAVALYGLARSWFDGATALCALGLWMFSPMMLGMGPLFCFDIAAASMTPILGYCFWLLYQHPSWSRSAILGLWLGASWLVKFSLIPIAFLFLVWFLATSILDLLQKKCSARGRVRGAIRKCSMPIASCFLGYLFVLAGYGFHGVTRPWSDGKFASSTMRQLQSMIVRVENTFDWNKLPTMLPSDVVDGLDTQFWDLSSPIPTLCFGKWNEKGDAWFWWIGLFLKTPPELLALALFGMVMLYWRCELRSLSMLLAVSLGFIVIASMNTGMTYHTRYMYCVIPFVCVLGGIGLSAILGKSRWLFGIVATSYLATTLWLWPLSSTYCNWTVSWRMEPRLLLQDSNLDWGQGWLELHRWLGHHQDEPLYILAASFSGKPWLKQYFEIRDVPNDPETRLASNALVPIRLLQRWEMNTRTPVPSTAVEKTICRCFVLVENPDDLRSYVGEDRLIELRRRAQ